MKRVLGVLAFALIAGYAFAHTPLILVDDNGDGTIFVECGFSNSASAAGLTILLVEDAPYSGPLKTWEGKKILFIGTLDKTGCAELVKPAAKKYLVVFDAGPGHVATSRGPILAESERTDWDEALASRAYVLAKWIKLLRGEE